ncbi:hypothetical protein [Bosea sp. ASV33]|uniref:hypothetical protein n=1 Tax=Bosea sp. ASV33 TaxID=2795106 RepID=UPI0018EB6385|nr:hypothetical protein [Bosea sp. ASV33]
MTKHVVISPCRATVGGAALARGEYFPGDDQAQIERLTKANCLLPEGTWEAKKARAEYEAAQAGARAVVKAEERQRAEAARVEAERARVISDEIAAAEKRRDEALATAEELEAKHTARLAEMQADLQAIAGEIAAAAAREGEANAKAADAEAKLQDLEQQIAAAEAELAKRPAKKA